MPKRKCPKCGRDVYYHSMDCDTVHDCSVSSSARLAKEDVKKMDTPNSNLQGITNKDILKHPMQGIKRTANGKSSQIYRERKHEEYIPIK